jgi:ADP-heptose:LPS heptosyltransferase
LPVIDEAVYLRDGRIETLAADVVTEMTTLARREVDLYFDLEVYSGGASVLAAMSFARNRYGFYRHSARFKKGNYTHLVYFNVRMPVARLYLQLYYAAGGALIAPPEFGPITVTADDVAHMRKGLAGLGLEPRESYLVVNANASDLLLERRWPADRFVATIETLTARGHRVVLIGSPREAAYVRGIHDCLSLEARARTVDSAGKLSLDDVFALIHEARCVVTNDTGPMHLAIAMHRPTVCLFGPGSPDHYGVTGPNIDIRYRPVVCSPCIYETDLPPCDGNNVCMQLIEPGEVVDAVRRLLREDVPETPAKDRSPLLDEPVRYLDHGGRALGVVARTSIAPAESPKPRPQDVDGD